MYGAILGDIVGSRFEFDCGPWTKDFDFLTNEFRLSNNCDRLITIIKLDWLRYHTVASKFILPQIYNNVIFRSIMTHIGKY